MDAIIYEIGNSSGNPEMINVSFTAEASEADVKTALLFIFVHTRLKCKLIIHEF